MTEEFLVEVDLDGATPPPAAKGVVGTRRTLRALLMVMAGILLFCGVSLLALRLPQHRARLFDWLLPPLALATLAYALLLPRIWAAQRRRSLRRRQLDGPRTICLTANDIRVTSRHYGTETRYSWGEVTRLAEQDGWFLLWLGQRVLLLPTQGFRQGRPEDFADFVQRQRAR